MFLAALLLAQLGRSPPVTSSGPFRWDDTLAANAAPCAIAVDVELVNHTAKPLMWSVADMPPWAVIPVGECHPEAGEAFSGWIDAGKTAVVHIESRTPPAAYRPGTTYLGDISFLIDPSYPEVTIPCSLAVTSPQ